MKVFLLFILIILYYLYHLPFIHVCESTVINLKIIVTYILKRIEYFHVLGFKYILFKPYTNFIILK